MKGKCMVVGMKFENFRVYREALRDYCMRNKFDVEYIRNEAGRITVTFKNENCKWRLHASPIQNSTIFQIKSLKGVHFCAKTFDNKLAKFSYIAKRVEVSSTKVSRAKRAAIDKIVDLDFKQYDLLWDYCKTVRVRNPGSLILLRRKEGIEPPTFDKMYVSLHAIKQGFFSGCRPIIDLDGCFLKTLFGGQLLVAVGRDGNDNMVPIAIAVVQVENYESWKRFLSVLLEDIGGMESARKWTFISDKQKRLFASVSELAPYAEHRY
ncbi:hypothetical protein BUALT_Bualt15G0096100 [Buddleja alternifolia]|uniref:Transposase MuDR plant domain-containing protein n=1 Tax=Buddleja alternifolia TaxID=168488 RepID=A0AAV6WJ69_9LAMI|nr:hypothetical protein BUALT_Bualt15G0096100 [Buddleja alternifolia]